MKTLANDHLGFLTDKVDYYAALAAMGKALGKKQRERLTEIARILKNSTNGQDYYELAVETLKK